MRTHPKIGYVRLYLALFCIGIASADPVKLTCTLPNQGETGQKSYSFTIEDDPAQTKDKIIVWSSILRQDFQLAVDNIERSSSDSRLTKITGTYLIPDGKGATYTGGKWELKEATSSSPLKSTWSTDFGGIREEYSCDLKPR